MSNLQVWSAVLGCAKGLANIRLTVLNEEQMRKSGRPFFRDDIP